MNDYGNYTRDGCGENQARNANTQQLFNTDWATDKWYSYVKYYNYNEPGYNKVARTFTRVVWKSTTEVGFGIAGKYVVARYCPKGNIKGEYSDNVFEMNACSETQRLVEGGVCQDCPAYERRFGGLNTCSKPACKDTQKMLVTGLCKDCPDGSISSLDHKSCFQP
jgi:hypothetical protein